MDIQKIIDGMSLDQKVGQMFIGNICGGETLDTFKYNFDKYHFGSIQFSGVFERFVRGGNYRPCGVCENKPLSEVAEFLHEIKKAAFNSTGIPIVIGGDQEGGIENSIFRRRQITIVPSQMAIGATGDSHNAYIAGKITAIEMKRLGLDMLYSPSLDINTNRFNPEISVRSFGDKPDFVAEFGTEVIRAYAEENIISTAKHFPGRGYGQHNAHQELESIDLDKNWLDANELLPFKKAISAGVDVVMMAHTLYPGLSDKKIPASLNKDIIHDLLRLELGFQGVIIPDTLTMFAISHSYTAPQAAVMCLEAGADMIFMKVADLYEPTFNAVKQLIITGRLSEERINNSLTRILELKSKRGLFGNSRTNVDKDLEVVGCSKHCTLVDQMAKKSIVVAKNDNVFPLDKQKYKSAFVVVPRDSHIVMANDKRFSHEMLSNAIGRYLPEVTNIVMDEKITESQGFEIIARSMNVNMVVVGIYSAGLDKELADIIKELIVLEKTVVVVNAGSPYEISKIPETVPAIMCTFTISPDSFFAAADIMTGAIEPVGKFPVLVENLCGATYA